MRTVLRTTVNALLAVVIALPVAGCSEEEKATPLECAQPGGARSVPLNVIRVLHTTDSPGGQNNKGCRLTDQQIQDYIAQAQSFYGGSCNVTLTWDGQIKLYRRNLQDVVWPARDGRTYLAFLVFDLQDSENRYDPSKLNIFFHGNLKFDTTGDGHGDESFKALAIDPSDEFVIPGTSPPLTADRHIFVNDRGRVSGPGTFVSADGILEHELGHWFLRQRSSQGGRYDSSEHCYPCETIMRRWPPHPGAFLEDPEAGVCERFEVWTQAGDWNAP